MTPAKPDAMSGAAALLREVLATWPSRGGHESALHRRVEGAAAGLDIASGGEVIEQREPFVYTETMTARTIDRPKTRTKRTRPLALAYTRVSTTGQVDDGASLDAQRELLTAEAQRRGWDVEIVADEGLSAKSVENRPALVDALERLDRSEADSLLVLRVDRLSRSVQDFSTLLARSRRRGWSLVALDLNVDTSSPAGDLMSHVLASVSQYERLVIGQRTREGMAQRRAEGVHLGRRPTLPESIVRRIVTERANGATLSAIAAALTADGVTTAHGGIWHAATIRRVLTGTTAQRIVAEGGGEL